MAYDFDGFSLLYIFSLSKSYNMETILPFITCSVPLHGYTRNIKIIPPILFSLKLYSFQLTVERKSMWKKSVKNNFF